ncbi:MAG: tetratricopeptide repeat protein [Blastocatellia bacterium]|nr:tetratricopeptide repeat protein [Blastocatellia bacterium]
MNVVTKSLYEFGPFQLDPFSRTLMRNGELVPVTPKALETLLVLIERRGAVVEREELLRTVWPDSFVEEGNLSSNIFMLRKVLGEDREGQQFIATVPRRGYRFVAPVTELSGELPLTSIPQGNSLAVLPFQVLNAGETAGYLGMGLTDALINRLAQVRQVVVRPTSAILKFANSKEEAVTIGQKLAVTSVIEGSVRQCGSRLRVSVQLVRVVDGTLIWGGQFDENFTDIFTVEDAIANRVMEALTIRLVPEEKQLLSKRYTENSEAYQDYLQGHYHWNQRTETSLKKSIEFFTQAVTKDPGYALAFAGLSGAYALLGCVHGGVSPREIIPSAREAAIRALELDNTLAEAHTALALVRGMYDWDWSAAIRCYEQALTLNPSSSAALHWYGLCLCWIGQMDKGVTLLKQALRLDPLSPIISANLAWAYFAKRDYQAALQQCAEAIALEPKFYRAHVYAGWVQTQLGNVNEALQELRLAQELTGDGPEVTAIGYTLAVAGHGEAARQVLGELKGRARQRYLSAYAMALVHTGLGERDEAFAWLHKAVEERSHWIVFLAVEPRFDRLRSDSRFTDLMRRIGFPSARFSTPQQGMHSVLTM